MALDAQGALQKAFEDHISHLVDVLFRDHSPFFPKSQNDDAVQRFEVGFQHALGLYDLISQKLKAKS